MTNKAIGRSLNRICHQLKLKQLETMTKIWKKLSKKFPYMKEKMIGNFG